MDGDDVGVIERARRLGLLDEALLAVRIGRLCPGQDLDGDGAIEVGVAGLVNHTHPAFAELRFDAVAVQRPANHRDARMPGYLRPFPAGTNQFRTIRARRPAVR